MNLFAELENEVTGRMVLFAQSADKALWNLRAVFSILSVTPRNVLDAALAPPPFGVR